MSKALLGLISYSECFKVTVHFLKLSCMELKQICDFGTQ